MNDLKVLETATSDEIGAKYPDKYSLLVVDEQREYGVTYGRLLSVADSVEELYEAAESCEGLEDKILHYITGDNLL
jgi:hypothetical protein